MFISLNSAKNFFSSRRFFGLQRNVQTTSKKTFYIRTLGCQMNVADSEVISSILIQNGYTKSRNIEDSDIILLNTCSIREKAEDKAVNTLKGFRKLSKLGQKPKTIGVLGCMAERLKEKLLDHSKLADIVAGPDSYRDLPRLIDTVSVDPAINVQLSTEETYADIKPVRDFPESKRAFISIMRGCNNMCSFCIVPFTRGQERSRDPFSILEEVKQLSVQGYKEVTLLGQNVNSYFFKENDVTNVSPKLADGFANLFNSRTRQGSGWRFHDLLQAVASVDQEMRIRFTSPHPKDFNEEVIDVIARHNNIAKGIHMPLQSGSTRILNLMRRKHTKEAFLDLASRIRNRIPDVEFSTDIIAGFCDETEEDHQETLSVMKKVKFNQAFIFAYSEREKTHAFRRLNDNVPHDVKVRRLQELNSHFGDIAQSKAQTTIGKEYLVLVERDSKKSKDFFFGRTQGVSAVVFQKANILDLTSLTPKFRAPVIGDFVLVKVTEGSSHTLRGIGLKIISQSAFNSSVKQKKVLEQATINASY